MRGAAIRGHRARQESERFVSLEWASFPRRWRRRPTVASSAAVGAIAQGIFSTVYAVYFINDLGFNRDR